MIDIYPSNEMCNTYIVFNDDKEGFLVDPGDNHNNRLINHIHKLGVNIKAIFITHGHYDHITALKDVLKEFPDAVTYISEDEMDVLVNPRKNLSFYMNEELTFFPDKIVKLTDNEVVESCGYLIKMIKTPFHTEGSCCYLLEKEKALFTGDTLFYSSIGRTDLPTGSARLIESSLSKLIALDDDIKVYPGHESITTLGREKKYNTYLRNLYK
jgi:glyoxylase-like metal-dependent hydrolase (beta-lactamase superfamily II)